MMLVGEVKFDPIFVEGMIIQQNEPIRISGTESVEDVKIKISLGNRKETVVPDEDGKWEVILKPLKGSFKKLTLKSEVRYKGGKSERFVKNILIGDVWLAAGGFNMDSPLGNHADLKAELAEVDNKSLKFTGIKKTAKPTPNDLFEIDYAFKKKWQSAKAGEYLDAFSPVAYHFAAAQTERSKFPIGIIECAAPNAVIESWIPKEEYLEAGFREKTIKGKATQSSSQYYNGMIHPLTKQKYKGVIWYHGAENSHNPEEYGKLFQTLIESWRKRFNNPNLYFFYVQSAPYKGSATDKSGKSLAWIREAQSQALKLPNTGMVVTTDLGIQNDKSPTDKKMIGQRLGAWAKKLNRKSTPAMGPIFEKISSSRGKLVLEFNFAGKGLKAQKVVLKKNKTSKSESDTFIAAEKVPTGFMVAGRDKVFHPATAKVSSNRVELTCRKVRRPVAVRYGWDNFPLCNVYNSFGLPMAPFRTDKFPAPNFDGSLIAKEVSLTTASGEELKVKLAKGQKLVKEKIEGGSGVIFKPKPKSKHRQALYQVDSTNFQKGASPKAKVTIIYYDGNSGHISLFYDSSQIKEKKGDKTLYQTNKPAGKITLKGSGKWLYVTLDLDDAYFGKRLAGADLKLQSTSTDFIISGVFVNK